MWLIVYGAGHITFVAGPYDDIGKCGNSSEADALLRENPRCELTAFPPFVGELAVPPSND
jgi:hypothetical protein